MLVLRSYLMFPASAPTRPARPARSVRARVERPLPVRLERPRIPSPFAPGRTIAFARVASSALARAGVREGDHVALARVGDVDTRALATVVGPDGTSSLWAVTREGARLRCGFGDPASEHLTERAARVTGIVVAILRRDA